MEPLSVGAQAYAWGKQKPCEVQRLLEANQEQTSPGGAAGTGSGQQVYAELWIGTHPALPSKVANTGNGLQSHLHENLSDEFCANHDVADGQLPFLAKVLSVARPLSVQAHPDKELAQRLHTAKPHLYKDGNHKPEMALALSEFRLLSGLRSVNDVYYSVSAVPELREAIGEEVASSMKHSPSSDSVARAFQALASRVASDKVKAQELATKLTERLQSNGANDLQSELALELAQHFPGDGGIFAAFLLQHVVLQPGEAIYQPVNEPHTYLSGDCVEVQASSDNVARAGLTSKECDAESLASMLARRTDSSYVIKGVPEGDFVTAYRPNDSEIATLKAHVPPGQRSQIPKAFGPSLLFVRSGSGSASVTEGKASVGQHELTVSVGTALLVYEGVGLQLHVSANAAEPLEAYVACVGTQCAA